MKGCIPDGFKTAVVSPLIKKATLPADDFKNYRPVTGLSFISKLVERVVAKQLLEHIHVHNLDNPYQSAYKTGHSAETSWVVLSTLLSLSRIWVCGSILIFPCPNMFRMSAKVVLCNSVSLDMSGSFLLMMLLYLWPMLLLVVGWITLTHFQESL